MKEVTITLDDETYAVAERIAEKHDRTLPSLLRDVVETYGELELLPDETEFDRLKRMQRQLLARWRREGIGLDMSENLTRDELYDRDRARREAPDAYR